METDRAGKRRLMAGVALAWMVFASSAFGDVGTKTALWESWLNEGKSPSEIRETLAVMEKSEPPPGGIEISVWHRVRAGLMIQSGGYSEKEVLSELDSAEVSLKSAQAKDPAKRLAEAKLYLKRADALRFFLDREIQKGSLYNTADEKKPFDLVGKYEIPSRKALAQGMAKCGPQDAGLRCDFLLAHANLSISLARIAEAFLGDKRVVEARMKEAAGCFRNLMEEDRKGNCPWDTALAGLNGYAVALLETGAGNDELSAAAQEISLRLKLARQKPLPLYWKTALHGNRLALLRKTGGADLRSALDESETVFREILSEQKGLMQKAGRRAGAVFFDDLGFLAGHLVLGRLELGEMEKAFSLVQRAKWTTETSRFPETQGLGTLKKYLAERGAVLAEQYITPEGLLTFILKGDEPMRMHHLNIAPSELTRKVTDVLNAPRSYFKCNTPSRRAKLFSEWRDKGAEVREKLLDRTGVTEAAKGSRSLLIAPHLLLSYLPYSGLPVKVDRENPILSTYTLETLPPIAMVPSSLLMGGGSHKNVSCDSGTLADGFSEATTRLTSFCKSIIGLNLRNQPAWKEQVSYFVRENFSDIEPGNMDSLPGASAEVEKCMKFMPGPRYAEAEATEPVFWKVAPSCRILYFATHGEVNCEDPQKSRILLAKSGETEDQDGYLTVREISEHPQPLPAELVVLSACQTALSENQPFFSDDLASMSRAFLSKGTGNVMATLWNAHDQAYAEIMPRMLALMREKRSPAEALNQSKREFLRGEREKCSSCDLPFFWASSEIFCR